MEIRIIKNENGIVTYEEIATKTISQQQVDNWQATINQNIEQINALEAENNRLMTQVDEASNILVIAKEAEEAIAAAESVQAVEQEEVVDATEV